MKKSIIISLSLLTLFLFCTPVKADKDPIQLVNFPSNLSANVGANYINSFNFIYTGNGTLTVSIANGSLPNGLKFSSIKYDKNTSGGSFTISGLPLAVGNFNLTLVLKDSYGESATQQFNFNVERVFTNFTLPTAMTNDQYSTKIPVNYYGNDLSIKISSPDESIFLPYMSCAINDGYFEVKLTPRKAGTYTIKADAILQGNDVRLTQSIDNTTFTLNVEDPRQTTQTQTNNITSVPQQTVIINQPAPSTNNTKIKTKPASENTPNQQVISEKTEIPTDNLADDSNKNTQNSIESEIQPQDQKQAQAPHTTEAKQQADENPIRKIFSNIWSFFKGIFKK